MADTACRTCNCPPDLLRRVEVRPIRPDERGAWDALVAAHHYLGLRSLFGKTLRYVATIEGRWLALLGWQAAALKCAARDGWIGWPRVLHYQRLHLLANNARFLILPTRRACAQSGLARAGAEPAPPVGGLAARSWSPAVARRDLCRSRALYRGLLPRRQLAGRRHHPRVCAPQRPLYAPRRTQAGARLPTASARPCAVMRRHAPRPLEYPHAIGCPDQRSDGGSAAAPQCPAQWPPAAWLAPSPGDRVGHRHRRRARRPTRLYGHRRVGRGPDPSPTQAPARPLQPPYRTLRAALRADAAPRPANLRCACRRCQPSATGCSV